MGWVLTDPAGQIERECADRKMFQRDVAMTYGLAILGEDAGEIVDWKRINDAVLKRWPRGLTRVKRLAWGWVEANRKGWPE
jgi:hypothetical protein